jgi:hypothetical protein
MMVGTVLPVAAEGAVAISNIQSGTGGGTAPDSGEPDGGAADSAALPDWLEITHTNNSISIVLAPEFGKILGISRNDIDAILDTLVEALKAVVIEQMRAGFVPEEGENPADDIWKNAVEDYVSQNLADGGEVIGGNIMAPIDLINPYGGFFFYTQHLVQATMDIFGFYPKSVQAFQNGGNITVVFRYADYDIVGLYTEGYYSYYAERSSENGVHGEVFPLSICFATEFDEYYSLLCGGEQKKSYEDFIAPVFVLNAIQRSLDSGKEETVNEFKL